MSKAAKEESDLPATALEGETEPTPESVADSATDSAVDAAPDAATNGGDAATATDVETAAEEQASTQGDRPPFPWRQAGIGTGVMAVALAILFVMMANEGQVHFAPIFGVALLAVAAVGLFAALGIAVSRRGEGLSLSTTPLGKLPGEPAWMTPKYGAAAAFAVLILGALFFGYAGLPYVVVAALLALLPAAIRRPGLLVFVVASGIFLPLLGAYGLWDPWETHYGEVAREILARDDWISLWWAQEDWFWSKPILIFWSEALSMAALNVDALPDANPLHPEWALRLPIFLMAMTAVMAVYFSIARVFSRRAGLLAALVLATTPHFFFLAHQSITDMPFVANMTVAMCLFVLAIRTDPEVEAKVYRLGRLAFSARHAVIALVVMIVLPQILYLASRNIAFLHPDPDFGRHGYGFAWHLDEFMFGSAGNHGVPGNSPVRDVQPAFPELWYQPIAQALWWLGGLAVIIAFLARERRVQRLTMVAFYIFCGLAFMGKGIPGFALPGLIAMFYLIASGRWSLLLGGQLRVALGALVVTVVGMPWYVAMFLRHGAPFTDRLLVHDHLNRLAAGVHGDTGSIEYFLEQLGFGLFPWVALVPAAAVAWLWMGTKSRTVATMVEGPALAAEAKGEEGAKAPAGASLDDADEANDGAAVDRGSTDAAHAVGIDDALETQPSESGGGIDHRRQTLLLIGLWVGVAFTLFSAMITKFHHYIFPLVPAAAILVGILLDRLFGPNREAEGWRGKFGLLLALIMPAPIIVGVAGIWGDVRGIIPADVTGPAMQQWVMENGWNGWLSRGLVALGMIGLWAAALLLRERKMTTPAVAPKTPLANPWALLGLSCVPMLVWMVGGGWTLLIPLLALIAGQWWLGRLDGAGRETREIGAILIAAPFLLAFVGRDLSWVTSARPEGYERLIHLFVYNYGRPWPEHLDYRPILTGFGIVATTVLAVGVFRSLRPVASRAFLGVALTFSVWCLDVYIVDLSPHWGQRELVMKYYEERASADEPLVAWQMNWKGENFYSGNRVSVFVDLDNRKIREWIERNAGKRAFVLMEHGRLGSFRSLVPNREVKELTNQRDNNKFVLISVVL